MADLASGSVLLAAGNVTAALPALRAATSAWRAAHMPHDVARTAVLLGLACTALGDRMGAEVEFDTARVIFGELGAGPDLVRVDRLVAGLAERLVVSPHTVACHVEHIYAKLGVANRTAATAYAYEHHLV